MWNTSIPRYHDAAIVVSFIKGILNSGSCIVSLLNRSLITYNFETKILCGNIRLTVFYKHQRILSMIFPELGPQFYDERDQAIKSRMESFYAQAITINQAFWGEADTDTRFEAGDQTLWSDVYGNLPANRRRQFNFNRIRRVKNMVGGHQRRNRKSTIVVPVENGDSHTADQFTKIMMWINQQEGVLETISESFDGALVTGMNFLHVWMDYRQDPVSGNIRVDNCSYNSFLVDPYFRKPDLSDCNAIWKRSFMTKRSILALLPDKEDEIISLNDNDAGSGRDGKFQFMPESYNYGVKNLLTYDEYYYRDYRTQRVLVDTETGETTEWMGNSEEALKLYLKQYPSVELLQNEIPTVKLAILVQGKVMYDGPQPNGLDEYPFVPVFAYYNPQMPYFENRIQGIVRGLRDAQYLYNRRKIIELDILESQMNSGFIYKEDSVVNPLDLYQQQGQGKGIAIKKDANMTDVQPIVAPQIPPSMIQLSQILAQEVQEISGVNEELLGSATDDKAGILSMLRQGAGLTTLQILFDQLDHAQKVLGKRMIDLIRLNFTPGKVQKILGGEKPAALFYSKAFGTYGAAVEEGLNTTTQKQLELSQRLQLREAGIPISDEDIFEVTTMQGKKQVMENAARNKQGQQQMQQELHQMAMQEQQARIRSIDAQAAANRGLGVERISRVEENEALAIERRAEAEKDRDIGLLNKVKALKEIDEIDLGQIEKLLALSRMLKQDSQPIETQPSAQAAVGS